MRVRLKTQLFITLYQLQEVVIVYLAQLLQLVEALLTEIIPMAHLRVVDRVVVVTVVTAVTEGKEQRARVMVEELA